MKKCKNIYTTPFILKHEVVLRALFCVWKANVRVNYFHFEVNYFYFFTNEMYAYFRREISRSISGIHCCMYKVFSNPITRADNLTKEISAPGILYRLIEIQARPAWFSWKLNLFLCASGNCAWYEHARKPLLLNLFQKRKDVVGINKEVMMLQLQRRNLVLGIRVR
jgi:hypothetical protein